MKYQVDCYDFDNLLLCNNYHFCNANGHPMVVA